MQRIRVDLPEPDGPQMTTFSPRETVRLTLRSTWKLPNHLCTPSNKITGPGSATSIAHVRAVFETPRIPRHRIGEAEIEERREGVSGSQDVRAAQPARIARAALDHAQ